MILADFGAEVIRLEPPGGDPMWDHPAYMLWQRGKQSVALDWSSEEGHGNRLHTFDPERFLPRPAPLTLGWVRKGDKNIPVFSVTGED